MYVPRRPDGHTYGPITTHGGYNIIGSHHGHLYIQIDKVVINGVSGDLANALLTALPGPLTPRPTSQWKPQRTTQRSRQPPSTGVKGAENVQWPRKTKNNIAKSKKQRTVDRISIECFIRQHLESRQNSRIPVLRTSGTVIFRARKYIPDPARIIDPPLFTKAAEKAMRAIDAFIVRAEMYQLMLGHDKSSDWDLMNHFNDWVDDFHSWRLHGSRARAGQAMRAAMKIIPPSANTSLRALTIMVRIVLFQDDLQDPMLKEVFLRNLLASWKTLFGSMDPLTALMQTALDCILSQVTSWVPIALNYILTRCLYLWGEVEALHNSQYQVFEADLAILVNCVVASSIGWDLFDIATQNSLEASKLYSPNIEMPRPSRQEFFLFKAYWELSRGNHSRALEIFESIRAWLLGSGDGHGYFETQVLSGLADTYQAAGDINEAQYFSRLAFEIAVESYSMSQPALSRQFKNHYDLLSRRGDWRGRIELELRYPELMEIYMECLIDESDCSYESDSYSIASMNEYEYQQREEILPIRRRRASI